MLKTNSKRILDIIAGQSSQNATKAYQEVHPTAKYITARANAYKLMTKTESKIYLQKHINKAVTNIVDIADNAKSEGVRLSANQDILDRTQGKATQQIQTTSNVVVINLDLSGTNSD